MEFPNTGKFASAEKLDGDKLEEDEEAEIMNENFFCLVDFHTIIMPQEPKNDATSTALSAVGNLSLLY